MLVNADVKSLEVVVAAELSKDKVLSQEIIDGVDIHEINRDRFQLGVGKQGRLIAKIFKFRLIYGGSAYSYAHDSDFMGVSTSEKYWQRVIDEYYDKYRGIRLWHNKLLETAMKERRLEIPSGRFFPIEPEVRYNGLKWPETIIKNYPVQGYGADLVMLARLQANKYLREWGGEYKFIATIHDSIVVDCPEDAVPIVGKYLKQSVVDVPKLCLSAFGSPFSLPLTAEVQYGPNKKEMVDLVV